MLAKAILALALMASTVADASRTLGFVSSRAKPVPKAITGRRTQLAMAANADPDVSIGWNSFKAVEDVPESLVRGPEGNEAMRRRMEKVCRDAQLSITRQIEELDGKGKFQENVWERPNGGGGFSRVMSDGEVFEKAGCSLSVVYGDLPPDAVRAATERGAMRVENMKPGERVPFFAVGLSSVMHPKNPFAPTMHFNYRYFETDQGAWWFGGGTDITPSYLFEEDMKHFHGTYKAVCDKFDPEYYPKFKKWADDYFYIKHRDETRGLGGIFFDDQNDKDPEVHADFAEGCLDAVCKAYIPIVAKRKDTEYTEKQKEWQLMRRGRYVEFNLVYDRGTIFGLKTGGRIESILMSLPETARWEYMHSTEPGSPEAEIMDAFRNPREW
eukprot:CAMPEP_0118977460 /NCGR_PEP_ID=MMETSP1173-20130426/21479_1 /TAXON_ID=1034831 /ORGANISM="Rhizochromulina marina cf, Strain CCMP1243" /LENGTH=383 /DNA_ID=CAMNT_0006927575 /DNA_START=38 /DNA_END=1186 /DNA_ORIENTATION=+